ncbi:MAG: fibronectin type III domain-containing protein [Candidatus Hydrogenedentota bacterium]
MRTLYSYRVVLAVLLMAALSGCANFSDRVCLTWEGDPATTMTVNFQSAPTDAVPVVYYDTVDHGDDLDAYPNKVTGETVPIPGLEEKRVAHRVALTDLEPDTAYYFVAGLEGGPYAKPGLFATMATDNSPVRFIVGGDMAIFPRTRDLLEQAATYDPDFVVVGGDLAYANGDPGSLWMWDRWFHNYAREMRPEDGRTVPMVLALGNHEINKDFEEPELNAPYFFSLFAQGGKSYWTRKFGANLVLFILDSGHTVPVDGAQKEWFAKALEEHADVPVKLPVYHVTLYPSHRGFDDARSAAQREHWLPLFDQYEIPVCFEHHDHTFKRTKPLRNNEVHPNGTVYLGDGCFGVPPREIEHGDAWYMEKALSTAHFWVVDVTEDGIACKAVDRNGKVFDQWPAE